MDEESSLIKKKNKAKREGKPDVLADVQKKLGDLYYNRKDFEKALVAYKGQMQACKDLDDQLNYAIAHRMIGEVYADMGNFKEALSHQNRYLNIVKLLEDLIEEQRALATLGRTYLLIADSIKETEKDKKKEVLRDAHKAFADSINLCDKLENTIKETELVMMRARLLLNLGLVREQQKLPELALKLIQDSKKLCEEKKLHEDLHRTNIALAGLYERANKIELALQHFDKAAKVDDVNLKNTARISKAELLLRLGEWVEAKKLLHNLYKSKRLLQLDKQTVEKYLRIAVVLCRTEDKVLIETDPAKKLKMYETMGDAATAAKSYEKALYYYQEMLSCAEETNSRLSAALTSLSQTLRDAGRHAEAIPYAQRELDLCTDPKEACNSALYLAGLMAEAGCSRQERRAMLDKALFAARDYGDPMLERTIVKELIDHERQADDFDILEIERLNEMINTLPPSQETENEEEEEPEDQIGAELRLDELTDSEPEIDQNEEQSRNVARTTHNRRGRCVVKRNEKGETQLHIQCIKNNAEMVEKLLEQNHPTAVRDHCGWTPLHEAANHGYVEIVRLLIRAGADVNDPGGAQCEGLTALHDAAANGHCNIVQLLLDHGANPNQLTKSGDTALDCLENWRKRVKDLTPTELQDFVLAKRRLADLITVNRKKKKRSRELVPPIRSWRALIDDNAENDNDDLAIDSSVSSWVRPEKLSAGEDYKRTIASMQHPGRSLLGNSVIKASRPAKITAPLIDSEEMLVDGAEWLEDDLGVAQRRERPYFDGLPPIAAAPAKRKSKTDSEPEIDADKSSKRKRISDKDQVITNILDVDDDGDSNISNDSAIADSSAPELWPKKIKKPRQLSLLKQGFTKNERSRSPTPVRRTPSLELLPHQAILVCPEQKRRSWDSLPSETVDLEISLENESFELKLHFRDLRKTMTDIEELIRHKFEARTGCRPRIRFRTQEDVCLPAEVCLEEVPRDRNRLKLIGEIVQNDLPPIADRYKKICETLSVDVSAPMLKALRSCENTSTFRMPNDLEVSGDEELEPLAKCLHYQTQLQSLNLSDTILFGRGALLDLAISRMNELCELHLQCCDIDYECLNRLQKLPPQLRVLDLSYNPFGSKSQQKLMELLKPLKVLQTLNLRMCELDDFRFKLSNDSLVNLDISWNPIGGEGAANFLQRQLLSLNLSNTLTNRSNVIDKIFFNETEGFSFNTLTSLELSSCQATDFDVEKILSKTPNLTRLVLSNNANITRTSLCAILSRKPTLNYIDLSSCKLIDEPPHSGVRLISPQNCTLIVHMKSNVIDTWEALWQGRVKIKKLPSSTVLFKPS